MREKIENMNIIYSVTINNIINNYDTFKTLNDKELENICIILNDTIKWLYNYHGITSTNITLITDIIFKNKNIQDEILNLNIENLKLYILNKLNEINFKEINVEYKKNKFQYIDFIQTEEFDTNDIDFIKNQIYTHSLLYSDLILLLINHYNFSFGKKKLPSTNWRINFINILNLLFYQVDIFINSTREDLYYTVLQMLDSITIKSLLFPTILGISFDYMGATSNIKKYISNSLFSCLHKLNNLYYIEIPKYNYNNSKRCLNAHDRNKEIEYANQILNNFNTTQKMFILQNGLNDNYLNKKEIDNFIKSISNNDLFKIYNQITTEKNKKLIEDNIIFIQDYCSKNDLKLLEFVYTPNYESSAYTIFAEFYIKYNNYKYKFILSKYNQSYLWKIILKNNKTYKINCYLKDDFKHLVQAMIQDS